VDPRYTAAGASAGIVAVLAGAIAVACWRAVVRTGNKRIQLVAAAFAIISAKNLVKALNLAAGGSESPVLELVFSLSDLCAVLLVAVPLLRPRGA